VKFLIILKNNPFINSSASSNRWKNLLTSISNFYDIELLIIGGYLNEEEKLEYSNSGYISENISYSYQNQIILKSRLKRILFKYILFYLSLILKRKEISKALEKKKYDYVLIFPIIEVMYFYSFIILKNKNHKLIIEFNEYPEELYNFSTNLLQDYFNKKETKLLKNKIVPNIDIYLVMTLNLLDFIKKKYLNKPTAKFYHLPMSVDFSRFDNMKFTKWKDTPYIAYAGSSSFIKDGVDILIKSFDIIAEKHQEFNLKIAAFWESDGGRMIELIEKSKFKSRIFYLGSISGNQIPELFKNSALLTLPRPNSKQAQGGFPTKLGEYLASGIPVCATTVGEIPDYLTNNESVFFAEPGSVDSFANAMDRALSNPELAQKVGMGGRKVAEIHFNKDVQAQKLHKFLQNL